MSCQIATPRDTIVRFDYLPMIQAGAAIREGHAAEAVEELMKALPYELGGPNPVSFNLYPAYLRGEAYLTAK